MKGIKEKFFRSIVGKNSHFIGAHKDEVCYIIGNGASLKSMDLTSFSDHIAIGLNHINLHKDRSSLNMPYQVVVEPFFFYPYIKNPYTLAYQRNILGKLFIESFSGYKTQVNLFVSLSNILIPFVGSKISYLYHFGNRNCNAKDNDISGSFSFMSGALEAGLGLAINMGFKKAILIGCDYLFTPMSNGHFYAYGPPVRLDKERPYDALFAKIKKDIEVHVITDFSGVSNSLKSSTYFEYTGKNLLYKENVEIVDTKFLNYLEIANKLQQYNGKIK